MKMKIFGWLIVGFLLYICPSAMGQTVFSSDLVGAAGPADPTLGGVPAQTQTGGVDFVVTSATVTITAAGKWKSVITGLVVPTVANDTVTMIAEGLVCGGKLVANTEPFAITASGNAKIKTTVTGIPTRCVAPSVIVYPTEFGGQTVPLADTEYIAVSGYNTSSTQ